MEKNILKNNIAIILVEPQLGENIGTTARAMLNFGFENLILVNPRDDWPNDYAIKAAAGAIKVIDRAKIYKKQHFSQLRHKHLRVCEQDIAQRQVVNLRELSISLSS